VLHLLLADSEPSKVPFYIAGLVLALWAVALAGFGLSRPQFPYNVAGQRAVIGVTLVLVMVTLGTAVTSG
jgi:hypothetical protein